MLRSAVKVKADIHNSPINKRNNCWIRAYRFARGEIILCCFTAKQQRDLGNNRVMAFAVLISGRTHLRAAAASARSLMALLWLRDHRCDSNLDVYFAPLRSRFIEINVAHTYTRALRNNHVKLRGNIKARDSYRESHDFVPFVTLAQNSQVPVTPEKSQPRLVYSAAIFINLQNVKTRRKKFCEYVTPRLRLRIKSQEYRLDSSTIKIYIFIQTFYKKKK